MHPVLIKRMVGTRARAEVEGPGALPRRLAVVTGKGKNGKEAGGSVVREAVAALLRARRSPFRVRLPAASNLRPSVIWYRLVALHRRPAQPVP